MFQGLFFALGTRLRNKILSTEEFLNKIRPYLKNTIYGLQKCGTYKLQATIAIEFKIMMKIIMMSV